VERNGPRMIVSTVLLQHPIAVPNPSHPLSLQANFAVRKGKVVKFQKYQTLGRYFRVKSATPTFVINQPTLSLGGKRREYGLSRALRHKGDMSVTININKESVRWIVC